MRPSLWLHLGVVVICTVAGLVAAMAAGVVTVSQVNRAFTVATLEITHGDIVRIKNEDEFTHQVYVDAPTMHFESDEHNPGESLDVPFPGPGTFEVRCHIHPKMLLTVTVH